MLFLETCTAVVSSGRLSDDQVALSVEDAARKDSAVHVSLSSDSLVKQPGDRAVPLPGVPESRRSPKHPTEIGRLVTTISEVLRRRAIAP